MTESTGRAPVRAAGRGAGLESAGAKVDTVCRYRRHIRISPTTSRAGSVVEPARYDGCATAARRRGGRRYEPAESDRSVKVKRRIYSAPTPCQRGTMCSQARVRVILRDFERVCEHSTLSPPSPTVVPIGADSGPTRDIATCTTPANLRHPAMSVPFGAGDDGLSDQWSGCFPYSTRQMFIACQRGGRDAPRITVRCSLGKHVPQRQAVDATAVGGWADARRQS